jgi:hypothetical protein
MLLLVGALQFNARTQETGSPKSTKPATEPKLLLEVNESSFAVWQTPQWTTPMPWLRIFSDGTAEVHPYSGDVKKMTLTPEQFEQIRSFLDQPELIALKDVNWGYGGSDYVSRTTITLHHRDQQQNIDFSNFYPRNGYTQWPGNCPKPVVKLQCAVESLFAEPDDKINHWHEDCAEILAK